MLKNKKQQETLRRIFEKPTPNNILWRDIESLLRHLGFAIRYQGGSVFHVSGTGCKPINVHRPHPGNQTYPVVVKTIRRYLEEMGIRP